MRSITWRTASPLKWTVRHRLESSTSPGIPPLGSALLGQRPLSARAPGMAPPADGPQVLESIGPAGLGLDDVIDLGGSADADVGVAQLAGIAVSLEHPSATLRPVTPIGVAVRRGLCRQAGPPHLGQSTRHVPWEEAHPTDRLPGPSGGR